MPDIAFRLRKMWNVFTKDQDDGRYNQEVLDSYYNKGFERGAISTHFQRPDRVGFSRGNERSIVTSVYNRIALDVAAMEISHVEVDDDGRYLKTIDSSLNDCLTIQANIDQTSRALLQDAVISMFDEGCIAIVPVETLTDTRYSSSYDIASLRVGRILEWYPRHVKIELYDDRIGRKKEILLPKESVAIVENPLYAVINEQNSTMQRLIRKLNLLDTIDTQSGSGKLDLIIQVPYSLKSETRQKQAEVRKQRIEEQLRDSKYGIAYTDGTERITQLNRAVDNNLQHQIEYLTEMLYSQLGITQEILNGTADDKTMLNYNNRTIEVILSAIVDAMNCKFITKNARTRGQKIMYFRDPFRLVPVNEIAEIADKLTRNEIAAPNEIRQIIGWKPSKNPSSDELRNRNISQSDAELTKNGAGTEGDFDEVKPFENDESVDALENDTQSDVSLDRNSIIEQLRLMAEEEV